MSSAGYTTCERCQSHITKVFKIMCIQCDGIEYICVDCTKRVKKVSSKNYVWHVECTTCSRNKSITKIIET